MISVDIALKRTYTKVIKEKIMKKILLLSALLSTFALGLLHISNSDVIEYSSETPTMLKANEEESDVYLLYFKSPTNWGTPNVWAWEDGPGTNPFPELGWPGRAMIEDENNDGWYYIYLPSYIDKVIFNATDTEGNAVQTDGDGVDPENKFTISPQNQWIDGIHEETKTNFSRRSVVSAFRISLRLQRSPCLRFYRRGIRLHIQRRRKNRHAFLLERQIKRRHRHSRHGGERR